VHQSLAPYRLWSQRLAGTPLADATAVVRHLGAVQSQEHTTAPWSIARRCGTPPLADVLDQLDAGGVVRTHVLRTTWHHVHVDDLPRVVAATSDRVMGQLLPHVRRQGLEESALAAASEVVVDAVRDAPGCTRDDVAARLDDAGTPFGGDLLAHIVMAAELRGEVAGRRDPGGPHRYRPLDLAPSTAGVDAERAWLAATYARGHGPFTPADLAWWSSLTLTQARRAVADAGLHEVELEGGTCRATIRRTGWSLLVYLDSTSDDVALLRRAIATTAHEIRGPVAVICGIAEASGWDGEEQLDSEMQARLMSSVARQARMLDSITADLLTAAQIQRGTLRIDLTPLDPRTVVESVAGDRYGIDVEVVVEDDRMVRADPLRLEQMVSNLLGNAIKYGEAPYTIRIRPDGEQDDHVAIDVVDRGAGVPEEFRAQLFKEFSRATGTVATGTGLGLYVVRTLAEAQNGDVSYRPGQYGGSVFTISLMAVAEPPLSEPPVEGAGGPALQDPSPDQS
jgi:signal transduction histidine kinase